MVPDVLPYDVLARCRLLEDVPADELPALFDGLTVREVRGDIGETMFWQGDPYETLHVLIEGTLAALFQGPAGKVIEVENLSAPDLVASGILFAEAAFLPVTLEARTPVRLLEIPEDSLLELFRRDVRVLRRYLTDMGDKVVFLAEKIRLFQFRSLRQKIASHLLGVRRQQRTDTIRLPYGRERLAEMLGVARPSLSREFSALVRDGYLEQEGRSVTLVDPEGLKELLEED